MVLNWTVTRFGTVWPATKFRFETTGGAAPDVGQIRRKLVAVVSVAVTFSTTAIGVGDDGYPRSP